MDKFARRPIIYTAYSKHFYFAKMLISSFVLNQQCIPLNPFTNWAYFMDDMVNRDLVVRANNNLILLADEIWTFGPIADGVFAEVKLANTLGKPVRHFSVGKKPEDIYSLTTDQLVFEDELLEKYDKELILKEFNVMTDADYIDIAIEISKTAKYPYGAIVVKDGKIIGRSDDDTLVGSSMYSHAELMAIESASKHKDLYGDLKGATLYVSCEPCMMCMGAILYEGFTKVVYAATLKDSNDYYCPEMLTDIEDLASYAGSKITVVKELHRDKAVEVLKNKGTDERSN